MGAAATAAKDRKPPPRPEPIPAGIAERDYELWKLHPQPGTVIAGAAHDAIEELDRLDVVGVDGQDVIVVAVAVGHGRGVADRIREALA